ncbi:hypothetical protein H2201_001203 [Coniosporium apollinis]|uniref:Zinc finger PHD-type domain-containing protein n=1 Tax=Coniosporium apollinis TaxID=61459 RepID=A0ABQ9P3J9_9PEZI|nr:hypothetical protein H2201_001203 [Coniosporium apollinis]
MPSRKRGRQEMEAEEEVTTEPSVLDRLRNMWEFASLMQYIFTFGKAVKIDEDFDIEDLEAECLKPGPSEQLAQIGLAMLKQVSSHKGLTLEIFDEYTRRQYVAKAPQRNPFGTEETPNRFADFDIFTKIRVLQQLSTWTFHNPDRIRERMPERDTEQTQWRIDPLGWDSEDRSYLLLDDDRLYRRTDPPIPATPPPKPKSKAKGKKTKATRGNKRRKLASAEESGADEEEDTVLPEEPPQAAEDDGFGGMKWECIAITLEDYNAFMEGIRRSRDPNEKTLYKRLTEDVIPIIEKRAEAQRQKVLRKQRELENLQKLATAKRSSRIADKMEKQKEIEAAAEAERKHQAELANARKVQERQRKMEDARESRMMTREQRLQEREAKRILHEEELAKLEENSKLAESNEARLSERHLKAEMARRQKELEKLTQEDNWVFDCSGCGAHGENLDDGSHSIACERCNVWQHSACNGIKQQEAERDDFHFICGDCKRRAADANKPKISLKLRGFGSSASPKGSSERQAEPSATSPSQRPFEAPRQLHRVEIPVQPPTLTPNSSFALMNGPSLSPTGQSQGPPGIHRVPNAYNSPSNFIGSPAPMTGRLLSSGLSNSPPTMSGFAQPPPQAQWHYGNGYTNGANHAHPQSNGSVTAETMRPQTPNYNPYSNSFERQSPRSGHSNAGMSPPKPPPSMSPPRTNGHLNTPANPLTTPHTSFTTPDLAGPGSAHSLSHHQSYSSTHQYPTHLLPGASPGFSPEKHSPPRSTGQTVAQPPVLPSIAALSPSARPLIMDPPVKNPTPERPRENGHFGSV